MPRSVTSIVLVVYCLAIFLVLDFTYSSLRFNDDKRPLRVRSPVYSHTLTADYDGFDIWGELVAKIYTNNLGFKDAAVRQVPLNAQGRRVLLIGDSFTEGIGLSFEETFAGMLYRAGQARSEKIEFLNAGVSGYSPTLYYAKIKDLLDGGLRFDEAVVFVDMSDIRDEATSYFCFDEIPEYRSLCSKRDILLRNKRGLGPWLQKKFSVTDALRLLIKHKWRVTFSHARDVLAYSRLDGWGRPGWNAVDDFEPLGIEGAIVRARRHMQQLADLLKRHGIALSVAVYPYAAQLNHDDRDSRQIAVWREFCVANCKRFIDLFPAMFAAKNAHPSDWYQRYFIFGDIHYNGAGNRVLFDALSGQLL